MGRFVSPSVLHDADTAFHKKGFSQSC